jgi:hypothetical protein
MCHDSLPGDRVNYMHVHRGRIGQLRKSICWSTVARLNPESEKGQNNMPKK